MGSCGIRGFQGTGGRYPTDSRHSSCTVFLSGPEAVVPQGQHHFTVDLLGLSGRLEEADVRVAARIGDRSNQSIQLGVRFGALALVRLWLEWLNRLWPIGLILFLAAPLLWSPRLIAYAALERDRRN